MKLLVMLLLLLVPMGLADAQIMRGEPAMAVPTGPGGAGEMQAELRVQTEEKERSFFGQLALYAGFDNTLNLTVRTTSRTWWNATFTFNVTGATVAQDAVEVNVPPMGTDHALVTIRPDEVGRVRIVAKPDRDTPSGHEAEVNVDLWALPPVSVRFVDPPPMAGGTEEEDGLRYHSAGPGGSFLPGVANRVRVRSGESIAPRVEVTNPLPTAVPPFEVELKAHERRLGRISVESLDPGQSMVLEFDDFVAQERQQGPYYGGGYRGGFPIVPTLVFNVGGVSASAGAGDFRVENGAIKGLVPTVAGVEVQDGLHVELLVPIDPPLGVPTRIRYNVTNYDIKPQGGLVRISIMTPQGLHYGVQGPESHVVPVALPPGGATKGAIDFTPRVTGGWAVNSYFESADVNAFGYGYSGSGFTVPGSVSIRMSNAQLVYAPMGEPVEVDLLVRTTQTLTNAQLRVASSTAGGFSPRGVPDGGEIRPGFAHRLLSATTSTSDLGTLRSGGELNVTVQLVSQAAGRYSVVPYLVSEGFAYTHNPALEPDAIVENPGFYEASMGMIGIAVQPRAIAPAWALAPLTAGLAFFVGMWTFRTRFVK